MDNKLTEIKRVVHGRWLEENTRPKSQLFICSACEKVAYNRPSGSIKGYRYKKICVYSYCPNCGAKMDLEE